MAADILVVDDEADIRMLIGGLLTDEGYATREAGNSDEALAAIRQRQPNLVILDIWLQGSTLDGLQILEIIKIKKADLNANSDDAAIRMIAGTAKNMGIEVVD